MRCKSRVDVNVKDVYIYFKFTSDLISPRFTSNLNSPVINNLDPLIFLCFTHDIETAIFGKVLSSNLNLIISEPAQPVEELSLKSDVNRQTYKSDVNQIRM